MIRRVAYKKAIIAGALGAAAWEVVIRGLIGAGVPMFDLVRTLGTMVLGPDAGVWEWWPVGLAMHALVGAIWAVFYAYFFWTLFDCPRVVQGLIFSLLPALLAGLIMVPQMDLMSEAVLSGSMPRKSFFAIGVGWGGPAAIVLGHIVFGLVLGYLYRDPVGYPAGERILKYG
ncbi:MAG: hypothetical protein IT174_10225 [Acidobacteria bacterium]|nr:hypothetical protein [Acidobacteriota bacterium]